MEESLQDIVFSIQEHRNKEVSNGNTNVAIGRAACYQSTAIGTSGEYVFWILNRAPSPGMKTRDGNNVCIYKNTPTGELLTSFRDGVHSKDVYKPGSHTRVSHTITVDIHNHSTFKASHKSVQEVTIQIGTDRPRMFQDLKDLFDQIQDKKQQYQAALAKQRELEAEQKKKAEEAERLQKLQQEAAIADAKRKEAEAKEEVALQNKVNAILRAQEEARREEEARRAKAQAEEIWQKMEENLAAIAQYEQAAKEANDIFEEARSFVRMGDQLRSQHLLDPTQERAKRSHMYDGVPIVIEGGPGTGKTTTMIQRLMFLISYEALSEYEILTEKQRAVFADPKERNDQWLFFSPTSLLLSFLKNNMNEEGLVATENNTTILSDFREKMMREYMLTNPQTDGPFMLYHPIGAIEQVMIAQPTEMLTQFEEFCVANIGSILIAASKLNTAAFDWHQSAVRIKSYCSKAGEVKDLRSLMTLFNIIQLNEGKNVAHIEYQLLQEIKLQAGIAVRTIKDRIDMTKELTVLFEKWRKQVKVVEEAEAIENEMDQDQEDDVEGLNAQRLDFEPKLYAELKKLLKPLSLVKYNSKQQLSGRQKELYAIVKPVIDLLDLSKLSDLAWFDKNYAFLCKGIESNILNQIPRLYKLFRKKHFDEGLYGYNHNLLEKLVKIKSNKRLHPDEQDLLLGFINNQLYRIYQNSRSNFEEIRNQKYVVAYLNNVKHVIGIDEATDYSLLDYYFIASFKHYEFSSITLCGDIMQGLNANGIQAWTDLNSILPGLEVMQLSTSYRQLPSLVEVSKKMYFDDQKVQAPYSSNGELRDTDPKPLSFVSNDEEEKAEWIANRVLEIYQYCNNSMPSIGIFIPDDQNVQDFADLINSLDMLNGIKVVAGRESSATKMVRVFHLTEVKGMEFEAAFFHNIDHATGLNFGNTSKIMRRHLYVGISRAATFLAATFNQEEGNEDTLKYFDQKEYSWLM